MANEPDLARARLWLVHDRGPDNARLLELAPERLPFLYDEARRVVAPLEAVRKADADPASQARLESQQ